MILEAVKDEKGYTLKLNYTGTNKYYKVNGQIIFCNQDEIITTEEEPVVELWQIISVITKYISVENGQETSVEEYNANIERLTQNAVYDDIEKDYFFTDLEEEYQYKRYKLQYVPFYEKRHEKIGDVAVDIKPKVVIEDNPYLIPLRHLGKDVCCQKVLYKRQKFYHDYVNEVFNKIKTQLPPGTECKIYDYNLSRGDFYVYIDKHIVIDLKNTIYDVTDNIDVIQKLYEKDKNYIENTMQNYLMMLNYAPNLADIVTNLKKLQELLLQIKPYQNSRDNYNRCKNYLDELIQKLIRGRENNAC
jgi:hypothetical protein